ncbi:hypothetical protein Mth01_12330 [Sphaerimonospora thailandensis]|uniref:Uncharacterized protein n=1 Tax=Sphaerimonospora thailandensis TaxID=795644 RepID=A0A8J3R5W0_9ACTN|nr:hypothetical protein Mth01_12330 [Sphaerimonospora thailandensis]
MCPVAQAMAANSGSFAARSPEMIRDKVDCEMPVTWASARWLNLDAAKAFSTRAPTVVIRLAPPT